LIADESMPSFVARSTRNDVFVRSPDIDTLDLALSAQGINAVREGDDGLSVIGVDTRTVGELAHEKQVRVWELSTRTASLEQAFLELTSESQDYALGGAAASGPTAAVGDTSPTQEGGQ
jgi:ABC-2 type transport system ATP-binding protein